MLTKELEKLMKFLPIADFKYKKEIKGFSWTKKLQDRQEEIIIGYRTFYPNMFQIYRPSVYIYFDIVENIIEESVQKCNIQKTWGDGGTIHTTLNGVLDIDYNVFETKISDENNFRLVSDEIVKLVEKGAMPFFEKYQTLKDVADLLADKTPEEVVPYIQGVILLPKTILILKMSNHPMYKEKLIEFRKVLATYVNKKDIYKQMLIVYDDLFADDLKGL